LKSPIFSRVPFFIAAVLNGAASAAFACDGATCPLVTQSQDSVKKPGTWTLDFGYRFMRQSGLTGISADGTRPFAPLVDFERQLVLTGHHSDLAMKHALLQTDMSYGVSSRVTLTFGLPIFTDRRHEQFDLKSNIGTSHNLHGPAPVAGGEATLATTSTDHGNKGFGDVQIGAAVSAFTTPRHSLVVRLAVKAPTGDYKVKDAFGSIDRPDVQAGTGSWDFIGAMQYQRRIGESEWSGFAGGWGSVNGTNDLNYRFGNQVSASLGITRATPGRLRLSAQVGFQATGRDAFVSKPVPATGLRAWTVTPGARMKLGPTAGAYFFVKIPVATFVNETRLKPRIDILAGISQTF
jgi:hypothetical protein